MKGKEKEMSLLAAYKKICDKIEMSYHSLFYHKKCGRIKTAKNGSVKISEIKKFLKKYSEYKNKK